MNNAYVFISVCVGEVTEGLKDYNTFDTIDFVIFTSP